MPLWTGHLDSDFQKQCSLGEINIYTLLKIGTTLQKGMMATHIKNHKDVHTI